MTYRYAVVGAGRQGTAAAYDFGRFGEAEVIWMADSDAAQAERSAERVNKLLGRSLARSLSLDAADPHTVAAWLRKERIQAFLSAVPYFFNLGLTEAAIQAGAGMTDLGGNSDVVLEQLARTEDAAAAGCAIVPDCGQVPGMGTSLIVFAMEQLDHTTDVYMWDGGLPQAPYRPVELHPALQHRGADERVLRRLHVHPRRPDGGHPVSRRIRRSGVSGAAGKAGGLHDRRRIDRRPRARSPGNSAPCKTRPSAIPGNFAQLKTIQRLGLLDLAPVEVDGQPVIPRHVLHALWDPQIRATVDTRDLILIRILAKGTKGGRPAEVVVDLLHRYDEATGFSAMEQGTGWHAAILTEAIAFGQVARGVVPVEAAMGGSRFRGAGAPPWVSPSR